MHSVALEKVFQTMCLDYSFVSSQNPLNLTKYKAIALRFFLNIEFFLQLS